MTVYSTLEVIGTSSTSIDDAIRGAIQRASVSFDDLQWFEVKEIRGRVAMNEVGEFQVKVLVGFTMHAPKDAVKAGSSEGSKKLPAETRAGSRQTRSVAAQVARKAGQTKRSDIARGFEKQKTRKSQK